MRTIVDDIKKETLALESRGLPSDSYFDIIFYDGSTIDEKHCNWHDISEEMYVIFSKQGKTVQVSLFPIKEITIYHTGLTTTLIAEQDERVYQSIASIATYEGGLNIQQKIVGRKVGKVKDGKVIEERYLSGQTNEVVGIRF